MLRWLEVDPTGLRPDVNMYRYLLNSPVLKIDPTGLAAIGLNPDGTTWTLKNGIVVPIPPSKADPPTLASNDERFRAACMKNGVPDDVTDILITTANNVDVSLLPALIPGNEHKYCNDWVDKFQRDLNTALIAAGYKDGLAAASKGGIAGPLRETFFFCPGGPVTGDENHTALLLTFKDSSQWWIDCSTLCSGDVANLWGGDSHFTPVAETPGGFEPIKPGDPERPLKSRPEKIREGISKSIVDAFGRSDEGRWGAYDQ